MDYTSLSSEIIDSWDFIKFPAKDPNRDLFRERKSIDDNNPCYCLLKGVRKKLSRRKEPVRNRKKVESSTSLILKKTTERQVFNDYSVLSFTNILQTNNPVYGDFDEKFKSARERPLIKVTVIPKSKQNQTANTQRRRKKNPYQISNPDTSINTKNVYVVVAGRKREKVYQINTLNNDSCCAGPQGTACLGKRCKTDNFTYTPDEYVEDCEKLRDFVNSNMQKYLDRQSTMQKKDKQVEADYDDGPLPCDRLDCGCAAIHSINNPKQKISNLIAKQNSKKRRSSEENPSIPKQNIAKQSNAKQSIAKRNVDSNTQSEDSTTRQTTDQGVATRTAKQLCEDCRPRNVTNNNDSPHKSRIRITGRLGLTGEDNYVLKCNATLDDQPIPTRFQTADCTLFPVSLGKEEKWPSKMRCFRPSRIQRDSVSQANICKAPCSATPTLLGKASQATQVDFDIAFRKPECSKKVYYDKVVQCYCVNTAENGTCVSDEDENVALKECQSPLVIISVYPKHESVEKVTTKPFNNINRGGVSQELIKQFSPQVYSHKMKQVYNAESKQGELKLKKTAARSRSPSPAKVTNKENKAKDHINKARVFASNSKKVVRETTSPGNNKKTKNITSKFQTKNVFQTNAAVNKKAEQKAKSRPASPGACSPNRRPSSPKPKQHATTGTNTEQMLAKKALVDDFTKKYTEQMERNAKENPAFKTKHNVSTVTVNIDGDKEYYNVMFSQGEMDTGVTVRKTIKNNLASYPGDNDTSTSLENFLFIQPENEPRKRSFSQTLMFDGLQNDPSNMTSKLNVRDSIEISHRREERNSSVGKMNQTHVTTNTDATNDVDPKYFVQLKHFRGDDCSISDPVERDKEIRELLGIDKGRFKPPVQKSSEASRDTSVRDVSQDFLRCLFRHPSQIQANYSSPISKYSVACENTDLHRFVKLENKTSPYQQLIQERSIKLLLRLDQRNKQRSIVLTPQQYAKVRKTIYHILLKKNCLERRQKCSLVSVGKVKAKTKEEFVFHFNKVTQTEVEFDIPNLLNANHSYKSHESKKRGPVMPSIEEFVKPGEVRSSESRHKETQEAAKSQGSIGAFGKASDRKESPFLNPFATNKDGRGVEKFETTVLFNACHRKSSKKESPHEYPRKAASSVQIHYARVEYTKHVMFSSSETHTPPAIPRKMPQKHSVNKNSPKEEHKNSASIHTIFKGRRRPLTPNLGASAYSLYPEGGSEHSETRFNGFNEPVNYELKPKKPFLKRLISCLVMRASRASDTKFPTGPAHKNSSVNSSIDSYHINSSLGAVDMSSSIYDTSASFYSNHTILPVTRMQKRGFFSSVRVFLNKRRS